MILDLLYPPACLHCRAPLQSHTLFCQDCLEECTLLSEEGRCQKCFSEIPLLKGTCKPCRTLSHPYHRFAACFEGYGPPRSLLEAFLKGKQNYLAKQLASLLVLQLERLHYPPFDLITPLPHVFFNPQMQIAQELSTLLGIPTRMVLKKELNPTHTFHLKKKCNIIHQSVLLLDTLTLSREPFRQAACVLKEGWCETIHGISLCVI